MDKQRLDVDYPLVDKDFNLLPESEEVAKFLSDENTQYDFYIHVTNIDMVPTALYMSMSKRLNVDCHAIISEFDGNYYIYSLLSSSVFETVTMEGL